VKSHEESVEQRGPRKGGVLLDRYEESPEREPGEVMPEVKELKELALQVLQPKKLRADTTASSYLPSFVEATRR
jgi:hypothetical protein